MEKEKIISFRYINYKGIEEIRFVIPQKIEYTSNTFHPQTEWLLFAYDFIRKSTRTFSLKNIIEYKKIQFQNIDLYIPNYQAKNLPIPSYPYIIFKGKTYPAQGDFSLLESFAHQIKENQDYIKVNINAIMNLKKDTGFMPNPMVKIKGANIIFLEICR